MSPRAFTRIIARFEPQVMQNGYAVHVDPQGLDEWDATEAFGRYSTAFQAALARTLDPQVLDLEAWIRQDPTAPDWVRQWSGPGTILLRRATQIEAAALPQTPSLAPPTKAGREVGESAAAAFVSSGPNTSEYALENHEATNEPWCNHDPVAWRSVTVGIGELDSSARECECGAPVLDDWQVSRLMVLRDRYAAEPPSAGSDSAAERDLEYFDEVKAVLLPGAEAGGIATESGPGITQEIGDREVRSDEWNVKEAAPQADGGGASL